MLKKSFTILKNNPIVILLFLAMMVSSCLIMLGLYPRNFTQFTGTDGTTFDFLLYMVTMLKMMIAGVLMWIISIIFSSGLGHMMGEAVVTGRTNFGSFLIGIRRYVVRILLSFLLIFAFSIVASIILCIIFVPIVIIASVDSVLYGVLLTIILMLIIVVALPFFMLWIPAIFIDNCSVIQGLTRGFKAGAKSYWKLLMVIVAIYIPIIVYMINNYSSMTSGELFTPAYIATLVFTSIISIFIYPILFILYYEKRQNDPTLIN